MFLGANSLSVLMCRKAVNQPATGKARMMPIVYSLTVAPTPGG